MSLSEQTLLLKIEQINSSLKSIVFWVTIIAAVLAFPSDRDKGPALAQCQFEASKIYPGLEIPLPLNEEYASLNMTTQKNIDNEVEIIKLCMRAAGHKLFHAHNNCLRTKYLDDVVNPYCYRPTSFFGKHWFDFRAWLSHQKWDSKHGYYQSPPQDVILSEMEVMLD